MSLVEMYGPSDITSHSSVTSVFCINVMIHLCLPPLLKLSIEVGWMGGRTILPLDSVEKVFQHDLSSVGVSKKEKSLL